MVVKDKPSKRYCCSDFPELEAKIISLFSLITSFACLFLLFLIYSHVQSPFFVLPSNETASTQGNDNDNCSRQLNDIIIPKNNTDEENELGQQLQLDSAEFNSLKNAAVNKNASLQIQDTIGMPQNESEKLIQLKKSFHKNIAVTNYTLLSNITSENSNTLGSEVESLEFETEDEIGFESDSNNTRIQLMIQCAFSNSESRAFNSSNSNASKEMTALDNMASFLLWNKETEVERIIIPIIWNGVDFLRALFLLFAVRKKSMILAKLWYCITVITCLAGLGLFAPIVISLTSSKFQIIFVQVFLLTLFYNFYALWIVYLLITEKEVEAAPEESNIEIRATAENTNNLTVESPLHL